MSGIRGIIMFSCEFQILVVRAYKDFNLYLATGLSFIKEFPRLTRFQFDNNNYAKTRQLVISLSNKFLLSSIPEPKSAT